MKWTPTRLQFGMTALAFLVVACSPGTQQTASPTTGGAPSIVGTWNCGPPEVPGGDLVEIRADGTVTITQPGEEPGTLTWSVEGNRGAFVTADGQEDPFTIEAERLAFDDGFVCTPGS